ncbi:MAG: acetylglutamate kinase [Rhodobacteraceae bacterium]|nr:MAG: acetylglutamate kinase [Paracoccaceae bacterium]
MKRDWVATARTLSEALPFLQRYDDRVVVIKFGGHAMGDDEAMAHFARDVVLMKQCNVHPVIVHGGGPQIASMLKRLGVESTFVDGLRVTDRETVEVVEMVLAGAINKRIVSAINAQGGRAVGLSGKDANLLICEKLTRTKKDPGSAIEQALDLGFVGEPTQVNPAVLETFLRSDFIPVVAPVGVGRQGETYNVNADTAAGAVAAALKAERLLLLTDVEGVRDRDGDVITDLSPQQCQRLIDEGVIAGGMIPKVRTALDAVEGGVGAAVILDGRAPHAVLLELFTAHGAGTLLRR